MLDDPAESPKTVTRRGSPPNRRNVFPHPAERRHLIHQRVVARRVMFGFFGQRGMREESKHAQPVIDGDQHHALLRQRLAIVAGRRSRTGLIAAGMNPHHHGPPIASRCGRGPNVEEKAILAHVGRFRRGPRAAERRLFTDGAELIGFPHSIPIAAPAAARASADSQPAARHKEFPRNTRTAPLCARNTGDHAGVQPHRPSIAAGRMSPSQTSQASNKADRINSPRVSSYRISSPQSPTPRRSHATPPASLATYV